MFVSDANGIVEDMGRLLVERARQFHIEGSIDPQTIPDNLNHAERLANDFISDKRQELQREAESQAVERVGGEVSRLNAFYDYKERAAQDKVEATQATLNRIRESGDSSQRLILPVLEANLRSDEAAAAQLSRDRSRRIAEAEANRSPQVAFALRSLGRIEIAAPA